MSLHNTEPELSEKQEYDINSNPAQEPGASDDSLSDRHHGTYHDVRDMGRLGKKQEFMVCVITALNDFILMIDSETSDFTQFWVLQAH
jgi:hypothetical protein